MMLTVDNNISEGHYDRFNSKQSVIYKDNLYSLFMA